MLARAALRVHRVPAPTGLPDLIEVLDERIAAVDLDTPLREFARRVLHTSSTGPARPAAYRRPTSPEPC
jgi:hypothetical protein